MGVLTSSQIIPNKNVGTVLGNPACASHNVSKNKQFRFKFKNPISGESHAFIQTENGVEDVRLIDGIVEFKNNDPLIKYIESNPDFVDASYVKIEKKAEEKKVYTLNHPEHTDDNPISLEFKMTVNKKKEKISVELGKVITEDEGVYKALLKKGYLEV